MSCACAAVLDVTVGEPGPEALGGGCRAAAADGRAGVHAKNPIVSGEPTAATSVGRSCMDANSTAATADLWAIAADILRHVVADGKTVLEAPPLSAASPEATLAKSGVEVVTDD